MLHDSDVVITGLGVVSPIGLGHEAFWEGLQSGRSGITQLPGVDPAAFPHAFGGYVHDFDGREHVTPRKALKVMSRELQMAFAASMMALRHASIDPQGVDPERIGTVFGSEMFYGPPDEMLDTFRSIRDQGEDAAETDRSLRGWGQFAQNQLYPLWMLKYLPNMPACHVGIAIGARGPNNTLVLDDVSGLASLQEGISVIQRGLADIVIVGAAGTRVNPTRLLYHGRLPLASWREDLASTSRPYAHDRDGYVGGEGAAAVILESALHAARRGQAALARVAGWANRFGSPNNGQLGSTTAIAAAINAALQQAGLSAADLSHVDGHGMGDRDLDAAEAQAIHATLGETLVTATKSCFGHLGAACGVVELAGAVLSLRHGCVPPTRGTTEVGEDCPIRLATEPHATQGKAVLKINHTPHGQAAAVVLASP